MGLRTSLASFLLLPHILFVLVYCEPNIFSHTPPANVTVGAYYYPWFKRHFPAGEGYVRDKLTPRQETRLGEYDDTTASVIQQHLAWSRQANVKVWIASWWGPTSGEDSTIQNFILPELQGTDHKIALFYETTGRVKEREDWSTHRVAGDLRYICKESKMFANPNYYRINGRPVLVVYLTRLLDNRGKLKEVVDLMRGACDENIYIIGDQWWGNAPSESEGYYPAFDLLDAITNYDMYGNSGRPQYAGRSGVESYYAKAGAWKSRAALDGAYFVPTVSPGYNDRGVRLEADHPALSRRLTPESEEGSLFETQLTIATTLLDPGADHLVLVNSFNEWHEDTQIEPCDGKTTTLPETMTQGVEYVGYGEMYLDILYHYTSLEQSRDVVIESPVTFTGDPVANANLAVWYNANVGDATFRTKNIRSQLDSPQSLMFPSGAGKKRGKRRAQKDLELSRAANISLWVSPWIHPGHGTNKRVRPLFSYWFLKSHRLALLYSPHKRVRATNNWDLTAIRNDIGYLCRTYFALGNYYKVLDGRPVLYLFLSRKLKNNVLRQVVNAMRQTGLTYGLDLYLIGDEVWGNVPSNPESYVPFQVLDAVMNFNVYGGMGKPGPYARQDRVDKYYEKQRKWRIAAWQGGCSYMPTVIPGYNDRRTRFEKNNRVVARNLTMASDEGSFFAASLDKAKYLLDSEVDDMIFVNSFNSFYEDTQIYPVSGAPSSTPNNYTQGVTYVGYEMTYLDMLTERFGSYQSSSSQIASAPLQTMLSNG